MDEKELLVKYKNAKRERDELKEALKAVQEKYDKAESALVEFLINKGAESTAKYESIGYAQLMKPRVFASCLKENEESLKEYLRKHNRADLIREVVAPQSLSAFVGELIEAGKPLPELVNYFLKQSVRMY